MKTKYLSMALGLGLTIALGSCNAINTIEYDGSYNSGLGEPERHVYFVYSGSNNTLSYSFATLPEDYTRHVVEIPVRIAGPLANRTLSYKVSVDESSTAREGIHYTALRDSYTIDADSVNGVVSVELLREHLSLEEDEDLTLTLRLQPTDDLGTGFPATVFSIKPSGNISETAINTWNLYMNQYFGLGEYTRSKYLIALQYPPFEGEESKLWRIGGEATMPLFLRYMYDQYYDASGNLKREDPGFNMITLRTLMPY